MLLAASLLIGGRGYTSWHFQRTRLAAIHAAGYTPCQYTDTIRFTQELPEGIQRMDEHENSGSSSPGSAAVYGRDFGAYLAGDFRK